MTEVGRGVIKFLAGLLGSLCLINFALNIMAYGEAPWWLPPVAIACGYVALRDRLQRWFS